MTAPTLALPCTGRTALYDAVLWPDEGAEPNPAARATAARLCAACPAPCEQKVTAGTAPRTVVLLDEDWLPEEREGRREDDSSEPWHGTLAGVPTYQCDCRRCVRSYENYKAGREAARIRVGSDYVRPEQRTDVWARMAASMADEGRSIEQIALELCVTADTARALLVGGEAA